MSFVDELRKKTDAYDSKKIREADIDAHVNRSIKAIKTSCEEAARKGKNRIDGLVYFDNYDSYDFVIEKRINKSWQKGNGELLTGFTKDEEGKIIADIQVKMEQLGFRNCEIKSFHPGRTLTGYEKKGSGFFLPYRSVPVYSHIYGFCVEVHIEW